MPSLYFSFKKKEVVTVAFWGFETKSQNEEYRETENMHGTAAEKAHSVQKNVTIFPVYMLAAQATSQNMIPTLSLLPCCKSSDLVDSSFSYLVFTNLFDVCFLYRRERGIAFYQVS